MIELPPKLTVKRPGPRPDAATLAPFQNTPTGFVVDAMFGTGGLGQAVKPIARSIDDVQPVVGVALTCDPGPADVMALMGALAFIEPGDVLVIAASDHQGCAAAGDRVAGMARNGGAVAMITDGPVRDFDGLMAAGLPIFASGINPNSPACSGPGKVGLPVTLCGTPIATGDLIVADRDGVVVVPKELVAEVAGRLERVRKLEGDLDANVDNGLKAPDYIRDLLASDQTAYVE